MKTETLNIIIAFLAFVFTISAGALVYLNAHEVVKKDDLARVEEQMAKKEDLAEVEERIVDLEEHVDERFDDLEDDIGYIKENVGGGGATPAKLEGESSEAVPVETEGESLEVTPVKLEGESSEAVPAESEGENL